MPSRTPWYRLSAIVGVLVCLAGCSEPLAVAAQDTQASDQACGTGLGTGVPVTMVEGLPVVAVQINGKPASLVLATNADDTALTDVARDRLGLSPVLSTYIRRLSGDGGAGRGRDADVLVDTLTFGTFRVSKASVPILHARLPEGQDGIIGTDILSQFDILFDLPHGQVVMFPPRACPAAPASITAATLPHVAPSRRASPVSFLVTLDEAELRAVIDSAARQSFASRFAAKRAGADEVTLASERITPERLFPGLDAGDLVSSHRFRQLVIGGDTLAAPQLQVGDLPALALNPEMRVDLLLGSDYLAGHMVWISNAGGSVHVVRSLAPAN
jgi:hypothetical protein